MKILLATSNPHKVGELRPIFASASLATRPVELVDLQQAGIDIVEPVEDQATFEGNAQLKAVYYAAATKLICLADDSGLEVDALDGAPGVYSARYAGVSGPRDAVDAANNAQLLKALSPIPAADRTARFVCAMALAVPADLAADGPLAEALRERTAGGGGASRVLHTVRGTIEGRILGPGDPGFSPQNTRGRGGNGFGYDPLFLVPSLHRTTAELTPNHKNRISHRGNAGRCMWQWLCNLPTEATPHHGNGRKN